MIAPAITDLPPHISFGPDPQDVRRDQDLRRDSSVFPQKVSLADVQQVHTGIEHVLRFHLARGTPDLEVASPSFMCLLSRRAEIQAIISVAVGVSPRCSLCRRGEPSGRESCVAL